MSVAVTLTLSTKEALKGECFCIDPVTNALVLKVDGKYVVVNAESIVDIEGDLTKVKAPDSKDIGMQIVPMEKWGKKEMEALVHAEGEIEAVNYNVAPEAQSLFDRLRNIFPCKWQGQDMIVFENIRISPPYTAPKAIGGNDDGMDRIAKVLEGERKKLNI